MSDRELMDGMYDFLCDLVPRMTQEERLLFVELTKQYYGDYDEEEDEDDTWDYEEGE